MRNEQLNGKISKSSTQQRAGTDNKKNAAYSFINFIMQDVINSDSDKNVVEPFNHATNDTTPFNKNDMNPVQITVFQLSEEEILKEMLTHLAADCPVLMQNKEVFTTKIALQYDTLKSLNGEKTCPEDTD